MRLDCPKCDAQYEVGDDAIPAAGREVQCSACGHGWFQMPGARASEAHLAGSVMAQAAPRMVGPEDGDEPVQPPEARAPAVGPAGARPLASDDDLDDAENSERPLPVRPPLDEGLLAILREEAARETALRRRESASGIDVQTDLGLSEMVPSAGASRAVRERLARLRAPGNAEATAVPSPPPTAPPPPAASTERPAPEALLPDIGDITSSLRSSSEHTDHGKTEGLERRTGRGFASGFLLVTSIALLGALLYGGAPKIASRIPVAQAALATYVGGVDGLRAGLDRTTRRVAGWIRDMSATSR